MPFWLFEVFMIFLVVDIKIGNLFVVEIRTTIKFELLVEEIVIMGGVGVMLCAAESLSDA